MKVRPPEFTEFSDALIGLPVSHVWQGNGSTIFLEFGQLSERWRKGGEPAEPGGEMSLMVEANWRIEDEDSIVCGSLDDDDRWPSVFECLLGSRVEALHLLGELGEISLAVSCGLRVVSFSLQAGEPEWTLFQRRAEGERWLAVEGGRLLSNRNG